MQLKKPTIRGCGLLNTTLVLVAVLGLSNAVLAQQPVQKEDRQARQLRVERALQIYEVESSAHVKLAHEKWQEGHLDDALKEFQQCLVLAKKIFGDEANSETVKTIQAIARLHESNGSFTRAVVDLRRALDFQITGTGAESWQVLELNDEIGRLTRLEKLGADRAKEFSRLQSTTVFISTGRGMLCSAVCIDPRGLFLARARPLANLWRERTTTFEYSPGTGELIGMRTEFNRDEPWILYVIINPQRPNQVVLPARIVRTSKTEDLALLVATDGSPLPAVELAHGHVPEVGSEVIALNHWFSPARSPRFTPEPPFLRLNPSIISHVRMLNDRPWILELADAPALGSSEGPLLDKTGRLVGFCVRGLPGTGLSYTIPSRSIEELLGGGVVLAEPQIVSYRERKREQEWTIPVLLTDPKAPDIFLELAIGEGRSRRSFRSGVAREPGKFVVQVVPVRPETIELVDLVVENTQGKRSYRVEDRSVSIGPVICRLSELRRVEFAGQPRVVAADGRVLEGKIGGLEDMQGQASDKLESVEVRSAMGMSMIYPPETTDPLRAEIVLRSRDAVLFREPYSIPIRDPRINLGGKLDVSTAPASGDRKDAPPATMMAEDRIFNLDGKIGAVAVGGDGRFLLMALLDRKEVVVFDAFSQHVTSRIPLLARDVLIAGAADSMLLVYPDLGIIHRWDLRQMTLERTAALPIRGEVKAVALGANSAGPMLVRWVERSSGGTFSKTNFSLIDTNSLKVLSSSKMRERNEEAKSESPSLVPEPGVFRLTRFVDGNRDVKFRASSRGDTFAFWQPSIIPQGFVTLTLRGEGSRVVDKHTDFGHLIPGQDGRWVFTGKGQRVDLFGIPLGGDIKSAAKPEAKPPPNQPLISSTLLIPSTEPAYFLAVDLPMTSPNQVGNGEKATIRHQALGHDRPLATLDVPWSTPKPNPNPQPVSEASRQPDDDQRFHWIPSAGLLIVIPPTNDRLVLHRVRIKEMLQRLEGEYLFVSSPRGIDVVLGRPFRSAIVAETGRGRARFTLMKGPSGLRLSTDGALEWDEPMGKPGDEAEVNIEISNQSMRPIAETIVLRILSPGGTSR